MPPVTKLTRRSALSLFAAAPAGLRALASPHAAPASRIYVGTYTDPVGTTPGAKGIYTCGWNAAEGTLDPLELAAVTPDPTFLARSSRVPNRLFAVNELGGDQTGTITTFAMQRGSTQLEPVNVVTSGGKGPCHLTLDHTGRVLFAANYGGGSIASYKVGPKGLSEPVAAIQFSGHSVDPERQTGPHAHCVLLSPDNRFLLVNDLGLDRIAVFHVDPASATLTPAAKPFYSATPGSGPRHAIFHPNGRRVYSVNELNSTIDLLDWSAREGTLTHKATVSSLPAAAQKDRNSPAELAIDAGGRFLYVSNRFHDSIGVFAIDARTGVLTAVQDIPCGGKTPRHFTLDPTGRWLLVAHQDSRNLVVLERNRSTGRLSATGRSYLLDAPVCILFG